MKGGLAIVFVLMLVLAAVIYIPVVTDCNERGGIVVLNAFKWPVCAASAP